MPYRSYFNWSGGKDSALALHEALQDSNYEIDLLLTSVNRQHRRVSMHGVQEVLLEQQAGAIGLPLQKLLLPDQPSMAVYTEQMTATMQDLQSKRYSHAFFGDIFLEDLKQYRETQLAQVGMQAVFPLWKQNTTHLMERFIDLGFKTIVVCINASLLDKSFAGRIIDKDFIKDLPPHIDPCGENGEFHTFVFDGPIFKHPVAFDIGDMVFKEYAAPKNQNDQCYSSSSPSSYGFWFCDLIPKS